jgi:hypothetical protein
LQTNPAHPSAAHGLGFHSQFSPDPGIVLPLGCSENHARS